MSEGLERNVVSRGRRTWECSVGLHLSSADLLLGGGKNIYEKKSSSIHPSQTSSHPSSALFASSDPSLGAQGSSSSSSIHPSQTSSHPSITDVSHHAQGSSSSSSCSGFIKLVISSIRGLAIIVEVRTRTVSDFRLTITTVAIIIMHAYYHDRSHYY